MLRRNSPVKRLHESVLLQSSVVVKEATGMLTHVHLESGHYTGASVSAVRSSGVFEGILHADLRHHLPAASVIF